MEPLSKSVPANHVTAVLLGFAAWCYGHTRFAAPLGRSLGAGFAIAGFVAAVALAASFATTGSGTAVATATPDRLAYEPFTAARLAALEAAGKPAFVNLTADW